MKTCIQESVKEVATIKSSSLFANFYGCINTWNKVDPMILMLVSKYDLPDFKIILTI